MRFLVMVFLSLFLMANVSAAGPAQSILGPDHCPDLKRKIEKRYANAEVFRGLARINREALNTPRGTRNKKLADAALVRASQYAAIYTALCK